MTYRYGGRLVTGATLELEGGGLCEVMLYPGHTCDLPESHPWVRRMVRRGLLASVPGQKTRIAKTKAAPEQAKETA